jgi:hypothetical protein
VSPAGLINSDLYNKNAPESAPGMAPGANPENKTRTSDNTMNKTYYLGLDVHKEKIAIACAPEGGGEEPAYYGKCAASVQNTERTLRKLAKKLGVEFRALKVCYEAGPTGFVLARRLLHLGLECVVIAPTKTERKPGEKIKTDRRDAGKLAKLFRNGDVTAVRIPPASDEAVRDVCRARTDAVDDLKRSKQRLLSFLLRNGYNYQDGTNWTQKHMNYLRHLVLADPSQKIVLGLVKVAVARELCAFVWELHHLLRDRLPARNEAQPAS